MERKTDKRMQWRDVTETFSERQRHYKKTYLEICEVYDEEVEVSLFSSEEGPYEIYFSYGIMYGIIYVEEGEADSKREEVKRELQEEYQKRKEPSNKFMKEFCKRHDVCFPNDIVFDTDAFMEKFLY